MTPKPATPLEFTTRYVDLDSLKGDPRNPKAHQLDVIDESMQRFGIVDRITVDERTGLLVSGHGRTAALRAMRDAGAEPPAGVTVDAEGRWLVPVNVGWASRNDAEAAAALIAMNRTTELGGWVDQSLLDLLTTLSETEEGFEGVGFTETDLEDLQERLADLAVDFADTDEDADPPGAGISGKAVTIKVTDAAVIAAWHDFRDRRKTDDEAMRALLLDGVRPHDDASADARARGAHHDEPTLADVLEEDEQ